MSPKRANSHHYSQVDLQPYGTETSQRPHQIAIRSPQKGLLKTEAIYHIAATQEAREPAQATFLEAAKTRGGPTDTNQAPTTNVWFSDEVPGIELIHSYRHRSDP